MSSTCYFLVFCTLMTTNFPSSFAAVDVAGGRSYFLKGYGVLLNQELIIFCLAFLQICGFNLMHTSFFMRKETMSKCAQLAQFDEDLYIVRLLIHSSLSYIMHLSSFMICVFTSVFVGKPCSC